MRHKRPNIIIEPFKTERYSNGVYSCQPNLIDKTYELINQLTDLEQRIELKEQLSELAYKVTDQEFEPQEFESSDSISQEIMDEFSGLSGTDYEMSLGDAFKNFDVDTDKGGHLGIMYATNVWRKLYGGHEELKPYKEKTNKWINSCPRRIYSWHDKVFDKWNNKTMLFQKIFPDNDSARMYLVNKRWPTKVSCPYCNFSDKIYRIENNKRFKCGSKSCHKKFSVSVGTMFESTNAPLIKWFGVMWLLSNPYYRTMSIVQISLCVGLTYTACWKMVKKIRSSVKNDLNFSVIQGLAQPIL